jgi:hypothetical protein
MQGGIMRKLRKGRVFISLYLIATILIGSFGDGLISSVVPTAEAVQSSIDTDAATLGTSHLQSGSQTVFIDDQTGYKFFRDAPGNCVYRKTTNGGMSWSGTTTVDAQTDCFQIQVWYDRWTPGDSGNYIHIATIDANPDDTWYNRLDTDGDTLLMGSTPVSVATAQGGTLGVGTNGTSITKGTDGTVYISSIDASDSYVMECSASCWIAGSWTETGTNPFGLTNNYAILAPLPNGDILAIHRDIVLEDIGSKVWNNGAGTWDAGTTTFDSHAPDNTTYDIGMAMTVSPTTGDIYLAYVASSTGLGADDQIRTATYSGGTWTTKKEVIRYTEKGITNVAIALDANNDDVYVAYSARTTPGTLGTGNIYWRKSVDDMASWTYEQGPVNSASRDFYGVDLNRVSTERIYLTWVDDTNDDILGDTIADIFQGVRVATVAQDLGNTADSFTQVTIDPTAQVAGTSHIQSGSQTVFTDDQTGYKFFRDAPGYCVYRKTTDGGASWSATTTVDAQADCIAISVWYDKWTPGSASTSIHIATLDTSAGDVFYNRLDTSGDTLLLGTAATSTALAQGGTMTAGANQVSITRGTDGTIYVSSIDASDSYVQECTVSCNRPSNWSETGVNPFGRTNNYALLAPLPNGNILAIHRDIVLEDMGSKVWNNGAGTWDVATTTFDVDARDNATYDVGMAMAVSPTTGDIYLAYTASNTTPGTDDQIRTAVYSGGAWTSKTVVSSSTVLGLTNVAIALDTSNDDVYVAYTAQATGNVAATANVLWKKSTNGMVNWGFEQGPVNTLPFDLYGIDLNIGSDARIYASWFAVAVADIFGATIADLPVTSGAELSSQITSVNASTSDAYVGGAFSISDTADTQSYSITSVTITENGTIDASTHIKNVKLVYESDTSAPYDCASESYDGSELQFGSTDAGGFSGADGVSSFTGTTLTITPTKSYCFYVVLDVLNTTPNNATIDIAIQNPVSDVVVSGSTAGPGTEQAIPGSTVVYNDMPTLTHYHFRNDDGNEAVATSKTSDIEDTPLLALQKESAVRLRIGISNEGGSSTPAIQYRLEYAETGGSCSDATTWTDVHASGGHFDMYDTGNLFDGGDTTNIALASYGAITDENLTFLTPNTGVKDTSSQTAGIVLTPTQFTELEYSIVASSTATDGSTYCFRVTDQGEPLSTYTNYPRASISADVAVNIATSSQKATTSLPATNFYVGSAFVISNNSTPHNVTDITISETGTVDAERDLKNITLYYDLDTSAPYDCAGESYSGGESLFDPVPDADGFSSANGTSTFTGSVGISTTATMCLYTVLDTTQGALHNETIDIVITNPSTDVLISGGGTVSPTVIRDMNGSTTLVGAVHTQTHYHFRNDNGTEVTASSSSGGTEDTPIANISQAMPVRLRMQVSNEGGVTSESTAYRLEYGTKVTTCSAVDSWIDVGGSGGAWDMALSSNLTEAGDTTNIATSSGGVTDENTTFLTPNSAIKESSSQVASTTLTISEFIEPEFSIQQTTSAGYNTTYCFRLSAGGYDLNAYLTYPELTTSPERDFEIQRGTITIATSSTSTTLVAGVDYIAPAASTSAFIRITNVGLTGAGHNTGNVTAQNATNTTTYIVNPSNIMTSVTIARTGVTNNTRVSWEIVEYIGLPGGDNEMTVRSQTFLTYAIGSTSATGTSVSGVVDDADVVVFITGQQNPDLLSTNYESGLNTSEWSAPIDRPIIRRGVSGSDAGRVSYAVVEFTGQNWRIQRDEHTFTRAGVTETEAISALSSLSKAFIHVQKRNTTGLNGTDEFGAEVWLSSIGYVSFYLEPNATTPSGQTVVVWIIENTQNTDGAMVVTKSSGFVSGGAAPLAFSIPIGKTLSDVTNASIFTNARSSIADTTFPRAMAGVTIASTTAYEIWRSNIGSTLTYRTEIVEWPTAGLALTQNYYRFYVDNNELKPTDAWPVGGVDLGENAVLTGADEPLGGGERVRLRVSIKAENATFPAEVRAFRLQYGAMVSSCSAIGESNWRTLGNSASSTIWRGYNATGTTDGTLLTDNLVLSVSDVAGTLEEINDTSVNANAVLVDEDIEYDWIIEQNGASAETFYCFRMVEPDGTPLDTYTQYPQLRTASFSPKTQHWRWYDNEVDETPTTTLAIENVAPVDITNGQAVKLRVTVKETENMSRDDVRFKLQYSESPAFSVVHDVVATSTCVATSTWCYADGGGIDNEKITTATLSDTEPCVAGVGNGCGTHNESPQVRTGYRHNNSVAAEYEFTVQSAGPRVNRVYYFRLFDLAQNIPVPTNTGASYPSLVTEGGHLNFTMAGIASTTVVAGVTLDIDSTPTTLYFGKLTNNVSKAGAHRLTIDTNGTEGYQLFMVMDGDILSASGAFIQPISGTNTTPTAWNTGCAGSAPSCFGYHTTDATLEGALGARFSAIDTYARMSTTTLDEVSYSSQPAVSEVTDVVFRILARQLQDAGSYEARIRYVSVPIF